MKYIRRYNNTKVKDLNNWRTTDKKAAIDIMDDVNMRAICITFGKNPRVSVYEMKDMDNFGKRIKQC